MRSIPVFILEGSVVKLKIVTWKIRNLIEIVRILILDFYIHFDRSNDRSQTLRQPDMLLGD